MEKKILEKIITIFQKIMNFIHFFNLQTKIQIYKKVILRKIFKIKIRLI
jgi:hypothetical protein